jgi:phosphoglycolate phosphatase
MPYKTIFFDLDGTLLDPRVGIIGGVQYALAKYTIQAEEKTLLPFIGPPLHESFQKYYGFDEKQSMEATMYYREYFIPKGMYQNTIYEGIYELLEKLKQANKNLYIVTSKPKFIADKVAAHYKLTPFFKAIIGAKADMSNASKKLLVKEALALQPDEQKDSFVMIGDREHDSIGAKANDIDSIGVLYGYGTLEEINNIQPTHVVKSITDLEKLLL